MKARISLIFKTSFVIIFYDMPLFLAIELI